MKKVLVVAGPTASGKSDFAIRCAKQLNGTVISGDSIQVYKGFDIGSGKVTEEEKDGVEHRLLDILDVKENYSVAAFQQHARQEIEQSTNLPIICGGTGLYLKACLYDYNFQQEDSEEHTDPYFDQFDSDTLHAMLVEQDPQQAEKVHPHNRQRLLRALTIIKRNGMAMSTLNNQQEHKPIYDAFVVGCTMERELLYARINQRVENMFQAGLKQEVTQLLAQGVTFQDQPMKGIGYREWEPYFQGLCTEEEVKANIQKNSRHFAKRQYTWFNNQMDVHWMNALDEEEKSKMIQEISAWMKKE